MGYRGMLSGPRHGVYSAGSQGEKGTLFRIPVNPVLVKEAVGCQRALWLLPVSLLNEGQAGVFKQATQSSGNGHSLFSFPVTFDTIFTHHSDVLSPLNTGLCKLKIKGVSLKKNVKQTIAQVMHEYILTLV